MKTAVIIAEYNPLHNGHVYHINTTKKAFPDHRIIVVMSGGFVMRGEPAVLNKYERAKHAILSGADAVIELPSCTSLLQGENFAQGGVNVAKQIEANVLSFGSECGDIDALVSLNEFLTNPTDEFRFTLKSNLKKGKSYPRAVAESIIEIAPNSNMASLLDGANNSLALMYLKALNGSNITPYTLKRTDNGYDSLIPNEQFLSATTIRERIKTNGDISSYTPDYVLDSLKDIKVDDKGLSTLILYKLSSMTSEQIKNLYDVGEGLENRLKKYAPVSTSIEEFLTKVKCKRYTLSRLKRICAYALFNIDKPTVDYALNTPYCRLIACKKEDKELISYLKSHGAVTCYSDLKECQKPLWDMENLISDTREIIYGGSQNNRNTLFI